MTNFSRLHAGHLDQFRDIVGAANVLTDQEALDNYAHDETEDLHYLPEVVLKPDTTEQVSRIMQLCQQENLPVTPRGGGTGLSGGALPQWGGVVMSMERFNRILDIDERNLQVTVEPGVITEVLQNAVREKGLFYPPDPSSRGSCLIGGNIAENSGGPKAVKYGVVKDYVLNLQVVLPSGAVIWTGANVLKNATGYNLTQLVVGSEGTLGIVTRIVLRLIPAPKYDLLMLVPFRSAENACAAVSAVFRAGYTPSALEFMERDALEWVTRYVESSTVKVEDGIQAHLLIEVDGNYPDVLMQEMEGIAGVVTEFDCGEILFAEDHQQKEELWKLRRRVAEAVKANSVYKEEDTVVPRAELPVLLKGVKDIGRKYGFHSVCYGHAGDGNLHVNIIRGALSDEQWNGTLQTGIREIFALVKQLGGTISGEHGIGLVQKSYMDVMFDAQHMQLMKQIKQVFDPNNILNRGKIFD
ncbi:MAG TPA: FAD-linked oxidase C-terminal domain-containing protein [Chitinophaga sp.]|uniref:FAD-binding oxidoreductase n=1 Tax=Chitinophaga sp. TaxID=1869181 RepID=UPI002DB67920|nr:FAD-linked oxidase C-terminal domain-containing protein [Chitinophaga sp.]HEU4552802.1 FAD-linked oxidase C-terminal domain-containing protein [Chitinophaga sp.]